MKKMIVPLLGICISLCLSVGVAAAEAFWAQATFVKGDVTYVAKDSDASPVDLGALVSIDRTTYTHQAVLTWTNQVTTGITVAKAGGVHIQTTTSSPYTYAKGILFNSVDTGEGENSKGADASLIVKNAALYKGLLTGYDAHAKTDLGNTEDGLYYII